MSERIVYECRWCGPIMNTPKERCLTYYLLRPDVEQFIDTMLVNSWMEIKPIQVNVESKQYIEAMRWYNMYRQPPKPKAEEGGCHIIFPASP